MHTAHKVQACSSATISHIQLVVSWLRQMKHSTQLLHTLIS